MTSLSLLQYLKDFQNTLDSLAKKCAQEVLSFETALTISKEPEHER